jgi:hypothetical protein
LGGDDPKYLIAEKCGKDIRDTNGQVDVVRSIAACKSVYPLDLSELPDILLFKDAKDPASVEIVDLHNPEALLGPGVVIRSASIQLTDEALTRGVYDHLPWARSWWGKIDSPLLHTPRRIFNSVGHFDFIAEGEG